MAKKSGSTRPVALVTGGGTGVGAATVLMLAQRGYDVGIGYRSSGVGAEATAERCRAAGAAVITLQGNVAEDADCRKLVTRVVDRFGRLDALVNNAGVTEAVPMKDLDALSAEHFSRLHATNVLGPFQLTRAAAPWLAKAAGAVVNVSSLSGVNGKGSSIAYAVSKGALNTLTLSLARALAPVRVNAVVPGVIDTDWMTRAVSTEAYRRLKQQVSASAALGGISTPEDIADVIVWLLNARTVTGELIRVDAGLTLGV